MIPFKVKDKQTSEILTVISIQHIGITLSDFLCIDSNFNFIHKSSDEVNFVSFEERKRIDG